MDGSGRFGRCADPVAGALVGGRDGEGLVDDTGDADVGAPRFRELVGEGGSDGRGYGFADDVGFEAVDDALGDVACFALASLASRSSRLCLSTSFAS